MKGKEFIHFIDSYGKDVYIRTESIRRIRKSGGQSSLLTLAEQDTVYVEGSPEEILARIAAAEK